MLEYSELCQQKPHKMKTKIVQLQSTKAQKRARYLRSMFFMCCIWCSERCMQTGLVTSQWVRVNTYTSAGKDSKRWSQVDQIQSKLCNFFGNLIVFECILLTPCGDQLTHGNRRFFWCIFGVAKSLKLVKTNFTCSCKKRDNAVDSLISLLWKLWVTHILVSALKFAVSNFLSRAHCSTNAHWVLLFQVMTLQWELQSDHFVTNSISFIYLDAKIVWWWQKKCAKN